MAAFVRLYTFLSQIFDYGSTAIEMRALFLAAGVFRNANGLASRSSSRR